MSKVELTTIYSGFYSTQALNNNFQALADALENTLSRDGTSPNYMDTADIDLNGNAIINGYVVFGSYTVDTVPSAVTLGSGAVIFVSNGDGGSACLAVSDGTNWKVLSLGSNISAS